MSLAAFQESAAAAAALVRSRPPGTRWFLDCDTDADGLCAAAVAAEALRRSGQRFTVRASRDKSEAHYRLLAGVDADAVVLLDKGTSHLDVISAWAEPSGKAVLVLDHHNIVAATPASITLLNPRASGLDGSRDASAATVAAAFALALHGDAMLGMAPVALAGAIGDWQHMGGWQGWNQELLERARQAGHVRDVVQPRFIGIRLAEAVAYSWFDLPGLSNDVPASEAFLTGLGLDPDAEVEEIGAEGQARLTSACALRLLAAGADAATVASLALPTEHSVKHGTSLRHLFRIVDACGREGETGTGIAFLLGDKAARAEAESCFARYKSALSKGLEVLRTKGVETRQAAQVAWTENPDYTGMVAGLAMTHVVADVARPLCVLAKRADGLVQVSTRGTNEQVDAGLDLGKACGVAARAVGSEGGGHPVAAGAVIPAASVEAFLAVLDKTLVEQHFVAKVKA